MPWQLRQHSSRSQFAHTFSENLQKANFLRSLVAIGCVPSNPHEIKLFWHFQTLTEATAGHAKIADSNDSKSGSPQGLVGSNPTASAKILWKCNIFRGFLYLSMVPCFIASRSNVAHGALIYGARHPTRKNTPFCLCTNNGCAGAQMVPTFSKKL